MTKTKIGGHIFVLLAAVILAGITPGVACGQKSASPERAAANSRLTNDPRLADVDSVIKVSREGRNSGRSLIGGIARENCVAQSVRLARYSAEARSDDDGHDFRSCVLTKVFATTAAVMKLLEQGKVRLNDPGCEIYSGTWNGRRDGREKSDYG